MLAVGFAAFTGFAVRVDILERLAARIRAHARDSATFEVPPTLAAEAGLTRPELASLVEALGFRPASAKSGAAAFTRPASRRGERAAARRGSHTAPANSPFAVLAGLRLAPRG